MKETTEFIVTLSLLFTFWYGIAETYVNFTQGIYTFELQSLLGIFEKFLCLAFFSLLFLNVFNFLNKLNIWTIGLSGMLSVFLKDLLQMFNNLPIYNFSIFPILLFDNFIFGVPFMLASYLVVNRWLK